MKKKLFTGILMSSMVFAIACPASAMPSDIREAVTQDGYSAYQYVNSYTYDDSDLISIGQNYVATADAVIRQAPFGEIIGGVTPGQTYYVVGECPDCMWYKISGSVSGYVYASYLVPNYDYTATTESSLNVRSLNMYMTITDAPTVNVRTAPSTSGSIVTVLGEGTEVHVTGNVLNTEWYECSYNGQTVYICDDYLTPEFPQTMACTAQTLYVRASADFSGQVLGVLNHGDKVRVSADENDWLRFSMEDGTIGYVYDEYMSVVE